MQISLDDIQPQEFTSLRPELAAAAADPELHESLPTPPQSEGTQYDPAGSVGSLEPADLRSSPFPAIDRAGSRERPVWGRPAAGLARTASRSDRPEPQRRFKADHTDDRRDFEDIFPTVYRPLPSLPSLPSGRPQTLPEARPETVQSQPFRESQLPQVFPSIHIPRQAGQIERIAQTAYDPDNLSIDDWAAVDQICRYFDATDAPLAFSPSSYLQALNHLGLVDHPTWKQVLLRAGLKEPSQWTDKLQDYAQEVSEANAKRELERDLTHRAGLFFKAMHFNRWLLATVYKTRLEAFQTAVLQKTFRHLRQRHKSLTTSVDLLRDKTQKASLNAFLLQWRHQLKNARKASASAQQSYDLNCKTKSLQRSRNHLKTLQDSAELFRTKRDLNLLAAAFRVGRLKALLKARLTEKTLAPAFQNWLERARALMALEKKALSLASLRVSGPFSMWSQKSRAHANLDKKAQELNKAHLAKSLLTWQENAKYKLLLFDLQASFDGAARQRVFKDWQLKLNMHREAREFCNFRLKAKLLAQLRLLSRDQLLAAKTENSLKAKVLQQWQQAARSIAMQKYKREKTLKPLVEQWRSKAQASVDLDTQLAQKAQSLQQERLLSTALTRLSLGIVPYYQQEAKAEKLNEDLACKHALMSLARRLQRHRADAAKAASLRDLALLKQALPRGRKNLENRRENTLNTALEQYIDARETELARGYFQFWRLKAADLGAGETLADSIYKAFIMRRWFAWLAKEYAREQSARSMYDAALKKMALDQALQSLGHVQASEQELVDFIGMRDMERCRRLFQRLRMKSDQAQFLRTIYERRAANKRREILRNALTLWKEKTRAQTGHTASSSPETPNRSATVFRERTVDRWRRIRTPLRTPRTRPARTQDGSPAERARPPPFSL